MNQLEEIKSIQGEIENTKKFQRLIELLADLKKKLKEGEKDDMIRPYVVSAYHSTILNFRNFSQDWKEGTSPKTETLQNAEKLIEIVLDDLKNFEEGDFPVNIFGEDYFSRAMGFLNAFKDKIKEENKKNSEDNNGNGNDDNGKNTPNNNGGGNQPSPNNTEIDKQIANLQSQIKTLENKIKNTPSSNTTDRQNYNQEIQNLKAQLKEKEKEKENKQSQQPSNNNFPTGWVVGGGILVGILLLVIIILASKKRN